MILAADWVVPMDGPPIADACVEVEEGRIVAVRPANGGEGERFRNAVILPGLVNAHTHLEYTAMAGFGDGLPFTPWIADHIRRKDTQAVDDLLDQSRAGAAACLAGGVTTVADCCYAGTVAQAAGEAGLRAIVYLEGFSVWEGLEGRIEAALDALPVSEFVTAGVSPHTTTLAAADLWRRWMRGPRNGDLRTWSGEKSSSHKQSALCAVGLSSIAAHDRRKYGW